MIGNIDTIQKLHISTIKLNEQPRKIIFHKTTKLFVISCVREIKGENKEINFLRLFNPQTFEFLNETKLEPNEYVSSLTTIKFKNDDNEYVVCGTALALPEENEPLLGRIIVWEIKNNKFLFKLDVEVKGAVYCLCGFNGKLLASCNSKLFLMKWVDDKHDSNKDLVIETSYNGSIMIVTLQTNNDYILIGDMMRSITILIYKEVDGTLEGNFLLKIFNR
jgi:DNA damage-binding protein 1